MTWQGKNCSLEKHNQLYFCHDQKWGGFLGISRFLGDQTFLGKNICIQRFCSVRKLLFRISRVMISVAFFNSDSFKKILMCLSGLAIKLQEGEYDTEPPSKTVRTFFSISINVPFNPDQYRRMLTLARGLLPLQLYRQLFVYVEI